MKKIINSLFLIIIFILGIVLVCKVIIVINDNIVNQSVLDNYLGKKYGMIKETFSIKYNARETNRIINGVNGWYEYDWIRAYEIRVPFREKTFEVWINNTSHTVFGDDFYDRINFDETFQHLYSE